MAANLKISSETPLELIWLHLASLESVTLARKAIRRRSEREGSPVADDLLERKAIGLAYTLRNARDYLEDSTQLLTKQILNAYYGTFSFLNALLISNPGNAYDLAGAESAGKYGHGLQSFEDEAAPFPLSQKVYVSNDGLFGHFLKDLGFVDEDLSAVKFTSRVKVMPRKPEEEQKLLSLDELLGRIPELASFYSEVTDRWPLTCSLNYTVYDNRISFPRINLGQQPAPPPPQKTFLRIDILGPLPATPDELVRHLAAPLDNCVFPEKTSPDEPPCVVGQLQADIAEGTSWFNYVHMYSSSACPSSWVKPMWGKTSDMLCIHFCTLYMLSIVVRYKPKLWREITEGANDEYLALIRSYVAVARRVVPELVLSRILNRPVVAGVPGTIYS